MGQRFSMADGGLPAEPEEGSLFFVGTATVILRYEGFTILIDPSFLHHGDHVHLGYGLTSRRLTKPLPSIEQPPSIDFVLLSQLHEDHSSDLLVEREIDRRVPILTTPRAAKTLRQKGFVARALATWETISMERADVAVRVTAMPGHGPGPVDSFLPDVMGSMLEFARPGAVVRRRLYVSGNTLVHEELRELRRRQPGVDVALFRVGGTRVLGLLTMDAAKGLSALRLIGPGMAVPIQRDGYDALTPPLEDFAAAARQAGLEAHVQYVARGDTCVFGPSEGTLHTIIPIPAVTGLVGAGQGQSVGVHDPRHSSCSAPQA